MQNLSDDPTQMINSETTTKAGDFITGEWDEFLIKLKVIQVIKAFKRKWEKP